METIGIVVMIVVMAGLLIFGGHRLMMDSHGGQGHATEQKTPAPAAVTNAVTMPPDSAPLRVPTSTGISNQSSQSSYENKK